MKKITFILLIVYTHFFAVGTYASIEITRDNNSTNIKNTGSFVSHMGVPSTYIDIIDKEQLKLKLDSLIQGKPSELIKAYNLLDQTSHLSNQEKSQWIENNMSDLPGPFLILNAVYLAENSPENAAKWYVFGNIRLHLDVAKCKDHSASSGIQIVKMALSPRFVSAFKGLALDDIQALLDKQLQQAKEMYKKTQYNISKPYWICLHGMKSIIAGMDGKELSDSDLFLPEPEYRERENMMLGQGE